MTGSGIVRVNALVLTQPQVFYGMANAGLLFRPLATPHVAIVAYSMVAVIAVGYAASSDWPGWFRSRAVRAG